MQQLRVDYWQAIQDVLVEDLVLIDESGVNLGLMRLFAWALAGKRAYGSRPPRGENVSLVAALGLEGVLGSATLLGACDGLTFTAFIARRVVPHLWQGAHVLLDNGSIHKQAEIHPLIEAVGARLVYLPSYSPDFSPIENFWSKVKGILRTLGARTYQALEIAIQDAFSQVTKSDIRNWFAHCCYCSS